MSALRGTGAAAHAPARPSLRALEEHVQMLRAEARTGLGSHDVRRALIKEEMRPHRFGGGGGARGLLEPSRAISSATSVSAAASAGAGGGIGEIPSAWLEGDFHLKLVVDDGGGGATASMSTNAAPLPPDSRNALCMYQALCTAADEVDYDVSYEEALRLVEERDDQTGLATTWRTRRRPSTPPAFSSVARTASVSSSDEQGKRQMSSSLIAAAANFPVTASHELYTKPLSRRSVAGCGAASRLSAALSASRPASQATVVSSVTSSMIATRRMKGQSLHSRSGGSGGALSSLSTEGTAVAHSSAATYAMALRQRVHKQREHASGVGDGRQWLCSKSTVQLGREGSSGGSDGAAALEWRTRVMAAVTVAVCSSCHTWFQRVLQQPRQPFPSETAAHRAVAESDDASGCCCPRCGLDVDAAVGADTPAAAAAGAGPRWVWAPAVPAVDVEAVNGDLDGAPARVPRCAVGRCPQPPPCPASSTRDGSTNGAGVETCGTDSVGFAENGDGGEEVSFAALVMRIRSSRLRAQEDVKRNDAVATSVSEAHTRQAPLSSASVAPRRSSREPTPAGACHGAGVSRACTDTGMSCEDVLLSPAARLPGPPSLGEPAFATRVDPFAQSLRTALSHLYFHDLWASAMGTKS